MKIGDKVRCITKNDEWFTNLIYDKVYEVKGILNENYIYVMAESGKELYFSINNFELVDDFEPTLEHLVKNNTEYVIEARNGYKGTLDKDRKHVFAWNWIDKDLKGNCNSSINDIMKIYRVEKTPVWQREEAKEMTLAEIEETLGYKVKLKEE